MVGGGPGSFIGPLHSMGAELDRRIQLVAGAFGSDAGRSRIAGWDRPRRGSHLQRLADDADGRASQAVRCRTGGPNQLHLSVALAAIEAGLHVACDKPATVTLAEALQRQTALGAATASMR